MMNRNIIKRMAKNLEKQAIKHNDKSFHIAKDLEVAIINNTITISFDNTTFNAYDEHEIIELGLYNELMQGFLNGKKYNLVEV